MKKSVATLLALLTILSFASLSVAAAAKSELAPYDKVFKLFRQFSGTNPVHYALYDIDGDGTKELLMKDEGWQSLYTIQNGKLVSLFGTSLDDAPPLVVFENGTIQTSWNDGGNIAYYRFINGEFKLQASLVKQETLTDFEYMYYRKNANGTWTEITEAEFNQIVKQYEGNGKQVKLKWEQLEILWWQKLPRWLQFILRYILFGWAWMK